MSLRVAIVGLGGIAQKGYLPVITAMDGLELLLHSRTPTKVERIKKKYRLERATVEFDELLSWKPQAAFVLTPIPAHLSIAKKLLGAGVDVFLEKPATLYASEAQELAEFADVRSRILMIAYNRRYAPLHIKAHELWANRPVSLAFFEKHRPKAGFPDLFSHVNEELVHIVDLLRFFCGDAEVVSTVFEKSHGKLVRVSSLLILENGGSAIIAGCLQAGCWYEHYALHGDKTSLHVDAFTRLQLFTGEQQQTWQQSYARSWESNLVGRGFVGQIEHFFNCVHTREQPLTTAWDSVKTQQLVEDIVAKAVSD